MRISKRMLVSITVLVIVGIAGFAAAHGGFGSRGHHMGHMDFGGPMADMDHGGQMGMSSGHHMGHGDHMGYGDHGMYSELTDEQLRKIDKARREFLASTRDLRGDLYRKRLEIRSELAKEDPDVVRVRVLQKELSQIEAGLDIKRLDYELALRKISPEAYEGSTGRGYGGGYCYGSTLPR
jgi:Spy/CpxP family protein refolding chaperone